VIGPAAQVRHLILPLSAPPPEGRLLDLAPDVSGYIGLKDTFTGMIDDG
jgi:hypothetical protein